MLLKASSIFALTTSALAHMEVIKPCPRYPSKCAMQSALSPGKSTEYSLNAPIGSNDDVLQPFYKHTTGITHVVIYQELRYCFYTAALSSDGVNSICSYTFNLPSNLSGTDRAIFACTRINAAGNREFYKNCGDVASSDSAGFFSWEREAIANYGGRCPVIPEFLGDYHTGTSYYTTNVIQINVTGNGYSGSGPSTTTV
ncbi:hypothetical protein GGI25_001659 [Coemansia spiralis]|uniref:AA1-like domain-containing protein n=1 Tax=Coemansia spiralis TaxID=417178 RepID=A0A9W8G5B3_9FUNG|nr:hypothetical protein GGI25_001659 [Coemansia spiralis]